MECFTHGNQIECPDCPPFGKRNRRHTLIVLTRNYSGCAIDMGACPECGKAWSISYKINMFEPCPDWNIPSRVEQEEKDRIAKEIQDGAIEEHDRLEYERLKTKFGIG